MLKRCTKCLRDVLTTGYGCCPSCRSKHALIDIPETELQAIRDSRRVVLYSHSILPQICPHCGDDATDLQLLHITRESPEAPSPFLALGSIARILTYLLRKAGGDFEQVVSIQIPECQRCAGRKLRIDRVDWEGRCVETYAHFRFSEAISRG